MNLPGMEHPPFGIFIAYTACLVAGAFEEPGPPPLHVLTYGESAGGFSSPPRGWNSWGLIATSALHQTQKSVATQCTRLGSILQSGHVYCELDSGWSEGCSGDEHGRLIPDRTKFPDLAALSAAIAGNTSHHGSALGVYVIPGTFTADRDKLVAGTSITLGSTWKNVSDKASKFCRMEFDFTKQGVQEWHNSVVDLLCDEYGVRYIKLDYVCPTASPDGCQGFSDSRPAVTAYHAAIARSNCSSTMRLGLSWMLDWGHGNLDVWQAGADSIRLDEDINRSGKGPLTDFGTVQRAIERYRVFVTSLAQGRVNSSPSTPVQVRPDMDNTFIANPFEISGLSDAQRWTMAMHWVGAGANLLEGGDLTQIDTLGNFLLTDPAVHGFGGIAALFSNHPMQPRNPHAEPYCAPSWPWTAGGSSPTQLQAWIAGPVPTTGDSLVILTNLGPDLKPRTGPGKSGTFLTQCAGIHTVHISFAELGLPAQAHYSASIVWDGRKGGKNHSVHDVAKGSEQELSALLGPFESVMFKMTKAS